MDYTEQDLQGLKVDHTQDEFAEGQQYILTLKDQGVLDDNSDGEVLENVDIQQSFKEKLKAQKKRNLIAYQNKRVVEYEEDEFATDELLTKYDDLEEVANKKKKAQRMQLGAVTTQLEQTTDQAGSQTNLSVQRTFESDYLEPSQQVLGAFRKKKQVGKKRLKSEPLALLQDDEPEDIIAALEGSAKDELQTRGERQKAMLLKEKREEEDRQHNRDNFFRAIEAKRAKKTALEQDMFELDEDYSLIESQLQKQRQLKLNKQNQQAFTENLAKSMGQEVVQGMPTLAEGQIEISQTTEFETGLSSITAKFAEKTNQVTQNQVSQNPADSFSLSQAKKGMTSVVNVILPSQRAKTRVAPLLAASTLATSSLTKQENQALINEAIKSGPSAEEPEVDLNETIIGKGIGNALKVLRDRGMLGKDIQRGRTKDQTINKQLAAFGGPKDGNQEEDRVKLNYFDKKGRKLTIKEAYRQMCWKFHGRMPSHKNQEKMEKKMEAKTKVQSAFAGIGALGSLGGHVPQRKKK